MVARKPAPKRSAKPAVKGHTTPESLPATPSPSIASRRARVADSAIASPDRAVQLPSHYSDIAEERGSGVVRRKNLNIDQGLLDQARLVLGVRTETEAVELGLGAAIELVEFHQAMLDGFDRLMNSGGFTHDADQELDFSGFTARPLAR